MKRTPSFEFDDQLTEALRREAAAERPAFSHEVHRRIADAARAERAAASSIRSTRIGTKRQMAVAAAVLIGSGLAMAWLAHRDSRHVPHPSPPVAVHRTAPLQVTMIPDSPLPQRMDASVHVGEILSASFWPPEIRVNLPFLDSHAAPDPRHDESTRPPEIPGSPEQLLATLQRPSDSASAALLEILPPDMETLAKIISQSQRQGAEAVPDKSRSRFPPDL